MLSGDRHIKPQWVRLMDVLVIGPLMMHVGASRRDWRFTALYLFGAATIVYNGANWMRLRSGR